MPESANNQKTVQLVSWVTFPQKQALLKRLIDHKGNPGLILRVAENDLGAEVAKKAVAAGFETRASGHVLTMVFQKGQPIPFKTSDIAGMLGGDLSRMPREQLMSPGMSINLLKRAPKISDAPVAEAPVSNKPRALTPDPDSMQVIGLNLRGEEVIKDSQGRFVRQIVADDGSQRFVHESDGGQAALFMRARKPEDLNGIAAGLITMAAKGTLHQRDFDRVVDAAMEVGPEGQLHMERTDVVEMVRQQMLRQITTIAVENEADRKSFHRALRLSANTSYILAKPTDAGQDLRPGASFLALTRRISRGHDRVDFRGDNDLSLALPRLTSDDASLQVQDMSRVSAAGITDYGMNVLSRRPAEGSSILIVPADIEIDQFERLRSEVGRSYGIEAVAEIASGVIDGVRGGRNFKILFVGARRPEQLEGLPQAALRSFSVMTDDDLVALEREISRSRIQIRDFNKGEVNAVEAADDDREENTRQRPYQPLSSVGEPFTMIPRALEGATAKALQRLARDAEEFGGVDAMVAQSMGRSVADLGEILTPEQVDALGLQMNARSRGRGFLVADQTGVGKGRTMAAMLRIHMREKPTNRCIYVTESAAINVPDVLRDLKAVDGLKEARIMLLTSGSEFIDITIDVETGHEIHRELKSLKPTPRRETFERGDWPEGYNLIITTYSQFNVKEDQARATWLTNVCNEDTLLILDEAHNALNPKSNTGRNFRAAIANLPPQNVAYATGTPSRDPRGMDLYQPLLPQGETANVVAILDNIASGGEVAQEAFATMLAEDGGMIRRDHDLSATEYQVNLPDDQRMLEYQATMNKFSPIVESMIDVTQQIGEIVGRAQAIQYRQAINAGMDERQAKAQSNGLSQYSLAIGGPLSNLARIVMNAIKVDQLVEAAIAEMDQGRKPLITFHSTNAALLTEMSKDEDGKRLSEEELAALPPMTLRDQIRRIHGSLYKMRLEGENRDPREDYPEIQAVFERIEALIEEIPDLSVSPVDALIERLEANNIRTGEISGRTLCYRDDRIQTRGGRNRKETIDKFNSGEIDALLYNSAGATGGSYHAGATFKDRRPRTLIEFEAPTDIIKYVQAQGRANRYDQVVSPKVLSVMTGLTPEMRILQQRNGKLRSLGASVDGNRSHPLLLDDVPDLLNKVGDEATRNVLLAAPGLARRLGFPKFAEEDVLEVAGADNGGDDGSGVSKNGMLSLSNKVLARSIMLPANEQDDLIQRIRMEFDVLIEELESRNANPLKPKEFGGTVDIRTTTLFSGQEMEDDDLDTSVFVAPVYMSTGMHDIGEDPVAAERLVTMVERAITLHGSDGFKPYAARINQNLATLLRHYLPAGREMDEALANPNDMPGRFGREHAKLTDFAWILENIQPGVALRFPSVTDFEGFRLRTIVDLIPPKDPNYYDMPSAYKIKTICPGDSKPETTALSRILNNRMEDIRFRPGISDGFNEAYLREFEEAAILRQQMPVQILSGNILQAITTANEHNLGTVSLYRDTLGQVNRGILVHDSKIDMKMLPVPLASSLITAEVATQFCRTVGDYRVGDGSSYMRVWGSMEDGAKSPGPRDLADIIIRITGNKAKVDMLPYRRGTADFYESRPGLYEAIHDEAMPAEVPSRAFRKAGAKHKFLGEIKLDTPEGRNRLYTVMEHLNGCPLMTDGTHRDIVNETIEFINREGPRGREEAADVVAFFEDDAEQVAPVAEEVHNEEWAEEIDEVHFQ